MTERVVYDCDGCDASNVEIRRVTLDTDRRMAGSGSSENISESMDLCIGCLYRAVLTFFPENKRCWDDAKSLFQKLKGKKWGFFWSYK